MIPFHVLPVVDVEDWQLVHRRGAALGLLSIADVCISWLGLKKVEGNGRFSIYKRKCLNTPSAPYSFTTCGARQF